MNNIQNCNDKTPAKILISSDYIGILPPSQHVNYTCGLRVCFIYMPLCILLFTRLGWASELLLLGVFELLFFLTFRFLIVVKQHPYTAILSLAFSCAPPCFFITSLILLSINPVPHWYYFLFFSLYVASFCLSLHQINQINFSKVVTQVNANKTFSEKKIKGRSIILFNMFSSKGPEKYGYKESLFSNILSKWIFIPAILIAPIAQMVTFTTPYRNLEASAFYCSLLFLIMAVGGNTMTFGLLLNWRLLRMKERGEI